MRILFAGIAAFLLLAAPMDEARAQSTPQVTALFAYAGGRSFYDSALGRYDLPLDKVVEVTVRFDQAVDLTGRPQLVVEVGSQKRNLDLYAGFGVPGALYVASRWESFTSLSFEYYVQASDVGEIVATSINLNGGTITSAETGEAANLVFEKTTLTHGRRNPSSITVDGTKRLRFDADIITGYSIRDCRFRPFNWPQSGDTYRVDEEIQIAVFCDVALTVTGTPQVPLIIGARTRYANYVPALSVASQPIFSYTVQKADVDSDGIQYGGPTPWRMNGGSVVLRGHNTPPNLPAGSYQTEWIVGVLGRDKPANVNGGGSGTASGGETNRPARPVVRTVTFENRPRYERTYRLGEQIRVTVWFSVAVTVTDTPQIGLTIGSQTRQAAYDADLSRRAQNGGGRGTPLVFTYTVQGTDADADGISIATDALTLNGGTISRAGDTTIAASLGHAAVGADADRKVDGRLRPPPKLTLPSGARCGGTARDRILGRGEELLFEVNADMPVTVTGTPRLELLVGQGRVSEWYWWRRGESYPLFIDRTPEDGPEHLIPPPSDAQVDRMIRYADYDAARSEADRLVFSYTVQAGDYDADGITVRRAPIRLNGGAIVERNYPTNPADPDWNVHYYSTCAKVDGGGTNPDGGGPTPGGGGNPEPSLRVSRVTFTGTPASEETYRLGEQIRVAVTFSDAVTVTGTPQIGLTVGAATRQATYDATRSKGTLLTFTYTVQGTDADPDGISIATDALALNGGTISLASDATTIAALGHNAVTTDETRKVDGSTDVVEHGDTREQATLLALTVRTTGEVGETGGDEGFQINVGTTRSAEIAGAVEQAGDADYFRVEVPGAGRLTVETTGTTDTEGVLQGATGQTLTEDDDGGTGSNFRLERQVQAGTYYVAVTGGENEQGIGLYTLSVRFTPVGGGTTVGDVVPPSGSGPPPAGSTPPDGGEPGDGEAGQPAPLRLNTETTGRLEQAGEVDYFRVEVEEAGTLTVEAAGAAAPVTYFGAGDEPLLHQSAAQSASGRSREEPGGAAWPVTAGTYHVAVVGGAARTQTGAYTVAVRFTAASEVGPLQATLPNLSPAQAWVHFYCRRAQQSEAAACTAQVQCGQGDGPPVAWAVEVAPETIHTYWPGQTRADGTPDDLAAALVAAGMAEAAARQRTTCRVYSADPLDVRAYTRVGQDVVPVAYPPAPVDATAPARVATLLNVAPAHAWVHLSCQKTLAPDMETVDPCAVRLQCGQQEGPPVAWEVDVAAETTATYGPDGTAGDLAAALVAAGKLEAEARRRTTCQVFSRDPVDAWAYTRVAEKLVSVANPPAPVDAAAPTRVTTLQNLAPADAWVHFYCRKAHRPDAETADPCTVRLQCGQQDGAPVAWDVAVAPETIFTYWPDRTAADGTRADFEAALIAAGKAEAEARRRTTCQVFSTDPVDVRGYTRLGGEVVPVANPPIMPTADTPTRIGTLLNLAPAHAWVHFYCRKAQHPDAETIEPCNVRLQCGQRDGTPVAWDVAVAPETLFSYWPGRTTPEGTSDNLAAALIAAGKAEAEARRRTTCQVFSADPVDVRGYTRLGETIVPVKN